jgi:hypothetical protein
MRRIFVASLLGICAFSVQAGGIGDLFGAFAGRFDSYGRGPEAQAKQLDDALAKVSEYMNKRMPEMIDPETRLDRVSSEPGPHFSYHYTLLATNSVDIDKASFIAERRARLKSTMCQSTQIRSFLSHGITVEYKYRGKDGLPVGAAEFAPDACDDAKDPPSKP